MERTIKFNGKMFAPFDLTLQIQNGPNDSFQDWAAIRDQNDANFARDVLVIGFQTGAYSSDFIPSHKWQIIGEERYDYLEGRKNDRQ